jgi:hypothetical protein
MIYAVYRCLYGEDFIQESIRSIEPHVDKIFVFWDNVPWGNVKQCDYMGETIVFPQKFDNILEKINELKSDKIHLIYDHVENNIGQFTHFVNDIILPNYDKPEKIIFIEVDHVFHEEQIINAINEFDSKGFLCASTNQIEHWKTPEYFIPNRSRLSTVFWNLKELNRIPNTDRHANIDNMPFLNSFIHNFGFCVSEKTMLWKHLTAIAFSKKIGDSPPNEKWYNDKWINWDFKNNNTNLEISLGCEYMIPCAYEFDKNNLPKIIKDKYGY